MGVFVGLVIDYGKCKGKECGLCVGACPVNVFVEKSDFIDVDPQQEDECTFCEVCLERCPVNCISIEKKYRVIHS